jgi:hypothetical protein
VRVVEVSRHGGPEVLEVVDRPVPKPLAGEVLVRHEAIGVNFVDTQHRAGAPYPVNVPFVPGIEAAGTVVDLGAQCDMFAVGDRFAFVGFMSGVYAAPGSRGSRTPRLPIVGRGRPCSRSLPRRLTSRTVRMDRQLLTRRVADSAVLAAFTTNEARGACSTRHQTGDDSTPQPNVTIPS